MLKKIPLREIPILGYISAGSPLELEDILYPIDTITMPDRGERCLFCSYS